MNIGDLDELHDTALQNGDDFLVQATEMAMTLRDANEKLMAMAKSDELRLCRLRRALRAAGVPDELVTEIEWDAH